MKQLPVPDNEKARLRALKSYHILKSIREVDFDRLAELASLICATPISLISFLDEKKQWIKSNFGLDLKEVPRELSICQYTIMDTEMLEVEDVTKDDRIQDIIPYGDHLNIRYYAGQPLIDPQGFVLGTLCVLDSKPRILTKSQRRSLKLIADELVSLVVRHRKKQELINFERLFDISHDLITIAGNDGYFKKVNPAFEVILGWDAQFLLSTPFMDFVHPEDVNKAKADLKRIITDHKIEFSTHRILTRHGSHKTIQWESTIDPQTGDLFCIGRDISSEKIKEQQLAKSEEKLQVFFDNSQVLMCTHDLTGKILSVNHAGASILGYTPDELINKNLFDITPESRHLLVQSYLMEIKSVGSVSGQLPTLHKDGSIRMWLFNNVIDNLFGTEFYVIGNAIDITEKYSLEKDLEKTRSMLEEISKMASVGGWEVDLGNQKLAWSRITRQIHEVPDHLIVDLDQAINFYKEGDSRNKIKEAIDLGMKEGKSWDLEVELITYLGNSCWVRTIGNCEFFNGKCKRLIGTFQDITKQKKAQLDIITSKKLLNDVLNAASEISIIATDKQGLITVFNRGAEKMLGYKETEAVGTSVLELIHLREEIQRRRDEASLEYGMPLSDHEAVVRKAELKGYEKREWIYLKKNGNPCLVSMVITPILDLNDQCIGYLRVGRDITESKKAANALANEKLRLSAFVEHAPAAVAMMDKQMKFIAASNRWKEDFHYTGEDLVGISYYEFFPNISKERKDRHQRILKGAIETKTEDLFKIDNVNKEVYLNWEMRPWYKYDGTIGGIMISTQNITSMVLHRDELREAKLLAEHASNAKSEFLANMSHEIRTPLNGVIGFTDLMLKTILNDTQQQYLSIVNQSANALLGIVNDILDFSKIEAGKLELSLEKCDLYEICQQAINISTHQATVKGIQILTSYSDNLPKFVWTDSVRLRQILINLLSNATKFTQRGEIELKIELLSVEEEKLELRFSVRDTGIGIKADRQKKIFDAFSQATEATTKEFGGTGLGLTISNKLLELMDSRLQLNSSPGNGSTFFFKVILKGEKAEEFNVHLQQADLSLEETKSSITGDAIVILIAEDNAINMLLAKLIVKKVLPGSIILEANNGFEAISVFEQKNPDLIMMDIQMPKMNGYETAQKIRAMKNGHHLPIIAFTAGNVKGELEKCLEVGMNDMISKPIVEATIALVLRRWLPKNN
jgi:PAS domain S-box-containing protein